MSTAELQQLAESILGVIRAKTGSAITYAALAKKFHVEPQEIDRAVQELLDWGYRLRRRRREAVTFVGAPDILLATEISHNLKTRLIGRKAHCYRVVKSTNDLASQLGESGAIEGTIVTAEQQTAGRGRLGRSWHSPASRGIYLSIVLRPSLPPEKAPGLSSVTALALAEVLLRLCGSDVQIKWPNDVLINGRKVAGILTELVAERGKVHHVVVGVGINVNHRREDFPEELRDSATSLRRVLKRKVDRIALLQQFLREFERLYLQYQRTGLVKFQKRLRSLSSLMDKEITLISGNRRISGKAIDIDSNGALVMMRDGEKSVIAAGEVSVAKQ